MFNKLRELLGVKTEQPKALQQALPMAKYAKPIQTADNARTNQMVASAQLPAASREVYQQPAGRLYPTNNSVADLTPATEDGYDTDVASLYGSYQKTVNPMPMNSIPGNRQWSAKTQHPAQYQGSNPFQSQPMRNSYPNVNPMPVDEMQYRRQIQPSYTNTPDWL